MSDDNQSLDQNQNQGNELENAHSRHAGQSADQSAKTDQATGSSQDGAAAAASESGDTVDKDKRLGEAEPEELVHALKKVVNGDTKAKPPSPSKSKDPVTLEFEKPTVEETVAASKSGYSNPFALFADIFYGVLVAPRQTLSILSDGKKFPPTAANICLTFVLVLAALALPAGIKVGAAGGAAAGWLKAMGFLFGNIFNWFGLAIILYYLGIWLRGHKLTPGNALIATGWAYLPFAFFAPVACFKGALGGGFTLLACLPALWFIVLEWFAFQSSLRVSTVKLALIAVVVPPIFCLVYLFWIGLAVCSLLAQLISHLS